MMMQKAAILVNSTLQNSSSSSFEQHRKDIDGLRALAILPVLVFHAFPKSIPGGFVGVDIFFVISGFLISGLLFRELDGGALNLGGFYARRIRRIFPALILVFLACMIVGWVFDLPSEYEALGKQVLSGSLFASNFLFWNEAGYFDGSAETKPLLHTWSLAVEEQFYIFWPFFLLLTEKRKWSRWRAVLGVILVSFAVNMVCSVYGQTADFYLPFSRLWELALGAGVALITAQNSNLKKGLLWKHIASVAGFVLIGVAMFVFHKKDSYPDWRALLPTCGAAFIIAAGTDALFNRWVLQRRFFVFIGLISYPLYLWHWSLLVLLRSSGIVQPTTMNTLGILLLSIIAATATYLYVERPIRRQPVTGRYAIQKPLIAAMIWIALAAGVFVYDDGVPSRMPEDIRFIDTQKFDSDFVNSRWRGGDCYVAPGGAMASTCIETQPADVPLVVLWGDSHVATLYPGLLALQARRHFRIGQLTVLSCPPILGYDDPVRPGGGPDIHEKCAASNERNFALLIASKPAVVVMGGAWWRYGASSRWQEFILPELENTIRRLQAAGVKKIILQGTLPTWPALMRKSLLADWQKDPLHRVPMRTKNGLADTLPMLNRDLQHIAERQSIIFIDPRSIMCNAEGCLTRVGDTVDDLTSWDDAHFPPKTSTYYMDKMAPILFSDMP